MIKSLLKTIKKDLESKIDLKSIKAMDNFEIHFGICMYIRNEYLWNNVFIVKTLGQYFGTTDVDDLSHKILENVLSEKEYEDNLLIGKWLPNWAKMDGKKLRDLRISRCLTQSVIAEKLGVCHDLVSSWEHGKRTPNVHNFKRLCEFFDVSADYFIK